MRRSGTALRAAALGLLAGAIGLVPAAGASRLAYPVIGRGDTPELLLAQRAIERSWGPSEDSVYVEQVIPDWRSEGVALSLSAAVPGLGQAYSGEERRGLLFAVAEAAGWVTRQLHRHRGSELRDLASRFVGAPQDSNSAWSFERWEQATLGDAAELRALYGADREAFYDLIAGDSRYAAGWGAEDSRRYFHSLREVSDDRLRLARYAGAALWINHLVAAVDAMRAARTHNIPLLHQLELKARSGWRSGSPTLSVAIVRRF